MMRRVSNWLVLPVITGLFISYATVVHAAAGDVVQTTGGGWMIVDEPPPTPTAWGLLPTAERNLKVTFGFVASGTVQADGSIGECQGELSYHDHGVSLRLHSLSVMQVTVIDAQTMRFAGTADVTTAAGSVPSEFVVTVHDGGEPGKGVDWFEIDLPSFTLSGEPSPYHRKGLLGGGNIQSRS